MNRIVHYLQNENSKSLIIKLIHENLVYYQSINTEQKIEKFSGTLYNYFVKECVLNNQYLSLTRKDYTSLQQLYIELILALRSLDNVNVKLNDIERIVTRHRSKLIDILKNKSDIKEDIIIPCSEYSPEIQLKILRIGLNNIMSPVIDIGCGKDAGLVREFMKNGIKVYGIDQYYSSSENIICDNWLNFAFLPDTWGTVISHMAFTNHFRRSISFQTSDIEKYRNKYIQIINSLKLNGVFIYSPRIPEIEKEIPSKKFEIKIYPNISNNELLDTVHLKRLCYSNCCL